MEPDIRILEQPSQGGVRRKPPKLKTADRTISVAIDNYSPSAAAVAAANASASTNTTVTTPPPIPFIIDPSQISDDTHSTSVPHHHASSKSLCLSPIICAPTKNDLNKSNIFYLDPSTSATALKLDDCPHHSRKMNFRRSDTLDPSTAYQIRKTHSFNINDTATSPTSPVRPIIIPFDDTSVISKRTNSVRHHTAATPSLSYPHEFQLIGQDANKLTNTNRRNCKTHRSCKEPHQHRKSTMKSNQIVDTLKCHSLGDEVCDINIVGSNPAIEGNAKRKLSPKFISANTSLENDLYRSRSNSRNKIDGDDLIEFADQQQQQQINNKKQHSHKFSSHSLDKELSIKKFGITSGLTAAATANAINNIASTAAISSTGPPITNNPVANRHTHSFYLNPNTFDELRLQRSLLHDNNNKKTHSASMRTRPYRDTLLATKKSKSFIAETYPEFNISPRSSSRRDSKIFTTDDAKRSPRLSGMNSGVGGGSGSNVLLSDSTGVRGIDIRKTSNLDCNEMDYDAIMRAYRQNRRKSGSISSASTKKKKKKSLDEYGVVSGGGGGGGMGDDEDDNDSESSRKRKKIVCIIVTVFLSLVFASVFVVVFTLTHSTVTQEQNQTKKVYTFSRDRDLPIHYNVRQENERLMESFNRGKIQKNFTDPAQLSAGEQIP